MTMTKMFAVCVFMLTIVAWAAAQQPGSTPESSGGQATSPSSQAPGAQPQPSSPGHPEPGAGEAGAAGQAASAPITEGCLGGSDPNYTVTDQAGKTYKLNLPPNANASVLASHIGESVQVQGEVKSAGTPAIDVSRIGRGTSKCPAAGGAQPPPKP